MGRARRDCLIADNRGDWIFRSDILTIRRAVWMTIIRVVWG